jgi:hypothetical protein
MANRLRELLTKENLRTDGAKAGAIVSGIFGIIAVTITNIDKITDVYDYFIKSTEARQAEGPWLGIFKEYDGENKRFVISGESVNLRSSMLRLDRIFGTVDSTEGTLRHHEVSGTVKDGFLITEYREVNPSRGGAVVYLLKGSAASGTLQGFWTGYDPDEREVMSCPYVLTRITDPAQAKSFFKDWLNKGCAGKNVVVSSGTQNK